MLFIENDVCDLENRFNTERESFPPLCIVTSYDLKHYGSVWTSNLRPNVNVLARVTILARQALAIIEPAIASTTEQFIKPSKLFTASHQGYDLVIQLKPELVANSLGVEFASPFKSFFKPNFRLPLAGADFLNNAIEKLRVSLTIDFYQSNKKNFFSLRNVTLIMLSFSITPAVVKKLALYGNPMYVMKRISKLMM